MYSLVRECRVFSIYSLVRECRVMQCENMRQGGATLGCTEMGTVCWVSLGSYFYNIITHPDKI